MKAKLNLKRAIKDFGSTNTAVAGQLGITVPSLYSYFKGNPSVETIYRISEILKVDPRDLFYAVDSEGNEVSHEEEANNQLKAAEVTVQARYESEISRLKAEIAKLQMQIPEIKPEISKNQGKISSDGSILDVPAYTDGLPVGSVRQGAKTYICPNCGTKFAILND